MKYIMNHEHKDGCIFCDALDCADGDENLIAYRGKKSFTIYQWTLDGRAE
jgi:hypothetical protein